MHIDLYKADISFFEVEFIPKNILENIICMVPNIKDPRRLKDLILISLTNVVYRIFSKIITMRMVGFAAEIISLDQGPSL